MTIKKQIQNIRNASALAWEAAIEGAERDGDDVKVSAALRAGAEAIGAMNRAIAALAEGRIETARSLIETARQLEAEHGDDQHARAALALLD